MTNSNLTSSINKIVWIFIFIASCSKVPDELKTPVPIDSDIELKVTRNNVISDNYSYAEISAITKVRPYANDLIVFKADKGLFSNNSSIYSVIVSSNDTTKALIKFNKVDNIRVTATVFNKFTKEVYVNYLTAFPSQIIVNPDSSSLNPSFFSKSLIKSKLIRQTGNVSDGLFVNYLDSVAKIGGGSIGTFLNSTFSDSQGQSTVEYWLQDTSYHGFVYIKSYVLTDTGKVVGYNKIFIR